MIEAFQRLSLTSSEYGTQFQKSQFSQHLRQTAPIKKLDCIIVNNFKSFIYYIIIKEGRVYIGPFLDFTSIIGPNGAGKSNVLNALMFCFCNERLKVQFYDLRQFIQRDGNESYADMSGNNKFCSVEAQFILQDKRKLTLRRTLYPDQRQQFVIDGEEYDQRRYQNFLMCSNLNYMTSNYAIWQGQIDKLILKTPKQLSAHLENIAGSNYLKQPQKALQQKMQQLEQCMHEQSSKLVKLKLEKKAIKKLHNTKEANVKIQEEYDSIIKKIFMLKVHMSEMQIKQTEKEIQATDQQQRRKIQQLNEKKIKMQKEQSQKIQIQSKMNILMKQIAELNSKVKSIQQSSSIIDIQTMKELQNQIQSLQKYLSNLVSKRNQLNHVSASFQSFEVDKQYLQVYNKWEKENQGMKNELNKKKSEYLYNQQILRTKKSILQQMKQKAQRSLKSHQDKQKKKRQYQHAIEQINSTISRMKVQNSRLTQQFMNNRHKLDEQYQKLSKNSEKIAQMEGYLYQNVENQKDKELVQKLGGIEGFKGFVQQWVKPAAKKYELCFQLMLGTIMKYIFSADEYSSKQIGSKLRENGQLRTLIILSNVKQKKQAIPRGSLGKLGQLAIDVIDLDKSLNNLDIFLKEYLHGKIVCHDINDAWSILSQNIRGVRQIYTLDGNVVRSDGMISAYGSVQTIKNKYKYTTGSKSRNLAMQQLKNYQNEKEKIQKQINSLKQKVNDDKITKQARQIEKLQARKQQLMNNIKMMRQYSLSKKQAKIPKGLQNEIEQLQRKVQNIRSGMKNIEKQMLDSSIFTEFLKRNKIDNLDSFLTLGNLTGFEEKIKQKNKVNREIEEISREIIKIEANVNGKKEKHTKIYEKVNSSVSTEEKGNYIRNLKSKQQQLTNLRSRISKLSNIQSQNFRFKSVLPQMQAKLSLLRQRNQKFIRTQMSSLGIESIPPQSQFKTLQQYLGCSLSRITRQKISQAQSRLTKQAKQHELELQKQNIDLSNINQQLQNEDKVSGDIDKCNELLKQMTERKQGMMEKIDTIKNNRKDLFMIFYNNLRPILERTYQQLTETKTGVTGKVDLFLENEEFPCDDGVYFYPNPPNKRFVYELDQLSGGEKSLASLALQYSIAMISKSPFLILDEIDAFLDAQNVQKFLKMVNSSIKEKSLQFIIITHKRSLFNNGLSLVGVTKAGGSQFSKAYSLLLDEDYS